MTKFYVGNRCALSVNESFNETENLQAYRKGLISELFLMFFLYFISQALHSFKYRNTEQKSEEVRRTIRMSVMNGESKAQDKPDLPWHEKKWNRTFAIIFSIHACSLGMCILFSPLGGAIGVAYAHFVFFIIFIVAELKMWRKVVTVARINMDILNLVLIIIALAGTNYAAEDGDGECNSAKS